CSHATSHRRLPSFPTRRSSDLILDLKNKYVLTDLTVTANFKSGFSWTLYDYLRGLYGAWYISLSKEALMKLFGVEEKKSYQNNRSEEHTSELQSRFDLVCRLLL